MTTGGDPAKPEARPPLRNKIQEEHLIAVKDDSTGIPPSIGTPSWMGILGGPSLGQPASRFTTFQHRSAPVLLSPWLWVTLAVGGFLAYTLFVSLFQ